MTDKGETTGIRSFWDFGKEWFFISMPKQQNLLTTIYVLFGGNLHRELCSCLLRQDYFWAPQCCPTFHFCTFFMLKRLNRNQGTITSGPSHFVQLIFDFACYHWFINYRNFDIKVRSITSPIFSTETVVLSLCPISTGTNRKLLRKEHQKMYCRNDSFHILMNFRMQFNTNQWLVFHWYVRQVCF